MSDAPAQNVPPELWEKIVQDVDQRDLAALALTSRSTHSHANVQLYRQAEVSMCKCSYSYLSKLSRTLSERPDYASICTSLVVDMSITCPVKTPVVLDEKPARRFNRFLPGRQRSAVPESKKSVQDCSNEGVDALRSSRFKEILLQLKNVDFVSIILGTFNQDATFSSSILEALRETLPKVRRLELRDLALSMKDVIISSFTSLRSIVLAYVSFSNSDLWQVLGLNAGHLDELRLLWVKESNDRPLFENCTGISLRNLRIFELQGATIPMDSKGFQDLLGDCELLQTFHLRSLTIPSANAWTEVMDHILRERPKNPLLDMRSVSFGAPTNCAILWAKVSQFARRCGDRLESLTLNGPVRGVSENHFPASIAEAIIDGMRRQPNLRNITIMWRDDKGVDADAVSALHSLAPSLEFLHLCLPYPLHNNAQQQVDVLVEQFKHFRNLRQLHLVFPTFLAEDETRNGYLKLNTSISNNDTLLQIFWYDIVRAIPNLEEVSWSTYEANVVLHPRLRHSGKVSYVKLVRDSTGSNDVKPEDQIRIYRDFESEETCQHPCTVGSKRFLLGQTPGWRGSMGNPLKESHKVCDYPEVDAVDNNSAMMANYHEL